MSAPATPRPRWANEWEALATTAEWLRVDRARRFPQLVAAGRMTVAASTAGLAAIAAIAADWKRVAARLPRDAQRADVPQPAKVEALEQARARLAAQAEKVAAEGGDASGHLETVELVDTLLFHQHDLVAGEPRVQRVADMNDRIRAAVDAAAIRRAA